MNFKKRKTIYLILVVFSQITFGQSDVEADYIKKLPIFTMYGDNYFVTGTSLNKGKITFQTSDAKFQIGFKQRLTNVGLPFGVFPFVSYRQKSFWNIYEESFPFRETNYNPSIGLVKLFVNNKGITNGLWFAFEHESNGRGGESSRSWNFFSLTYFKPIGKKWQIIPKFWIPVGGRIGNEDIIDYRGYFSVRTSYRPMKNTYIDVDVQPAFEDELRGFVRLGVSFKISDKSNQFFYIQYFGGYSEDLINYNQFVSNLRVGIVFKDLIGNFR